MTRPTTTEAAVIEEALAVGLGRPARLVGMHRLAGFSTHPIHRLEVELSGRKALRVIFKRLRPRAGKQIHREVLIYRRLLSGGRFGAPLLYGSVSEPALDRHWLLLEDVGSRRLDGFDADMWEEAFRWMAGMHAAYYGREDELSGLGCLAEHDTGFYELLVEDASSTLQRLNEPGAVRRFEELIRHRFPGSIKFLASQPRTLVHGSPSAPNLMVDGTIRPVDWEGAAIGLPAWDLAKLLAEWRSGRKRLLAVYLGELAQLTQFDEQALRATLDHAGVLRLLRRIHWCADPAQLGGLMTELDHAFMRLETVHA